MSGHARDSSRSSAPLRVLAGDAPAYRHPSKEGAIQSTAAPSSVAHEVADPALELADVGHPALISAGPASSVIQPRRQQGRRERAAALRRPLPAGRPRAAACRRFTASTSATTSCVEPLVAQAPARLEHLGGAGAAPDAAQLADASARLRLHPRELQAPPSAIASREGAPETERGLDPLGGPVPRPRDRLAAAPRDLSQGSNACPAPPAYGRVLANTSSSARRPRGGRARAAGTPPRCPRPSPLQGVASTRPRVRGRWASASSPAAP